MKTWFVIVLSVYSLKHYMYVTLVNEMILLCVQCLMEIRRLYYV